uniref:glycosyltransferase n=1 Tax=Algoriphagus sp. TaxID=1872435 RepID=UPI0040485838
MKKKVLFIITSSEIGGAQKFVKEQIDILHESNFKCFLATNSPGWLSAIVENKVDSIFYSSSINKFSLSYIYHLCFFIKNNNIDLIICNSAYAGLYGRISAFILNIKSIYVSHGWSSIYNGGLYSFILNKIEYILSLITTNIICISNNDFVIAINKIGISKNKLTIIPNSILPLEISSEKLEVDKNVKILAVCRLKYPKRVDLLIDVCSKRSDFHLTIVGDGPDKEKLLKKIYDLKISNILMLGNVDGFDKFYNYDVFVLISESEGLPISALEAMSCGLGIVLSDVGGCSELICNNGVLVNNSIDEIENGISVCIEKIDFFKKNSINFFNSNFNLEINKYCYIDYYNSYISNY